MLLADAVQAVHGKLYILGGGWSVMGPQPTQTAIAIKIEVPWDQADLPHTWRLELLDSDGRPVLLDTDAEGRPVEMKGEFKVGRPPGLKPGTPLDVPLALTFGALPVPPGGRYVWRLTIDGRSEDDWRLAFSTLPEPAER